MIHYIAPVGSENLIQEHFQVNLKAFSESSDENLCLSLMTPSTTSLMYWDILKAPGGFRSLGIYWKSRGSCSSVHRYLENPFLPISSRQSQVRLGHWSTWSGMRALTGQRKRFQRLSLKVQLKNCGDTNRVLLVLGKTKVWSVLDLSRNKNQVLEFYNKVLRKKKRKSGLLPAATLNNISTQKHPKNYLICIQ